MAGSFQWLIWPRKMAASTGPDLARRAAIHAALADPARLRITDTLLAGDASPPSWPPC